MDHKGHQKQSSVAEDSGHKEEMPITKDQSYPSHHPASNSSPMATSASPTPSQREFPTPRSTPSSSTGRTSTSPQLARTERLESTTSRSVTKQKLREVGLYHEIHQVGGALLLRSLETRERQLQDHQHLHHCECGWRDPDLAPHIGEVSQHYEGRQQDLDG